jgi:hypothetical protein
MTWLGVATIVNGPSSVSSVVAKVGFGMNAQSGWKRAWLGFSVPRGSLGVTHPKTVETGHLLGLVTTIFD